VPDGEVALKSAEGVLGEDLGDQPHTGVKVNILAVGCRDSCAFLAAVLKRKEGKKGKASYIFTRGIDPKNTTGLVQIRCL